MGDNAWVARISTLMIERGPDFPGLVMCLVYETIKANPRITLNQLRWLLNTEYLLSEEAVDGAVAALSNKNLMNCVTRWQNNSVAEKPIHLTAAANAERFLAWRADLIGRIPELACVKAPIFSRK